MLEVSDQFFGIDDQNNVIPTITSEDISYINDNYQIDISNLPNITSINSGMIKCIKNIKSFSCTYKNMVRQIKIYFSENLHIFLFLAYDILISIPIRLELVSNLVAVLSDSTNLVSSILYSLALLKKLSDFEIFQYCNLIEFLKCSKMLLPTDYEIILNYISPPFYNKKCYSFLFNLKSNDENLNENENVNKFELSLYDEEEEEEEAYEEIRSEDESNDEFINEDDQYEYSEEEEEYEQESDDNEELKKVRYEAVNFKRGHKGNRYSDEMKKFASLLYLDSKFSYFLMRELFCFPSEKNNSHFYKSVFEHY